MEALAKAINGVAFDAIYGIFTDGFQRSVAQRLIGGEEEFCLVDQDGEMPSATKLWQTFDQQGWQLMYDDVYKEQLVGVTKDGMVIVNDAGRGLVEINLPVTQTLHQYVAQKRQLVGLLVNNAAACGFKVLGMGIHPQAKPGPDLWVKKGRYEKIIERFAPEVNNIAIAASTQVLVDVALSEVIPVTNSLNALSGLFTALTANAAVWQGQVDSQKRLAVRQDFWNNFTDQRRLAIPEIPFSSIADYLNYIMNLQFLLDKNGTGYIQYNRSFGAVLSSFNWQDQAELVRMLTYHEGCCWFDTRPRFGIGQGVMEIRPCCQAPPGDTHTVAALTLGLMENLPAAQRLASSQSWSFWKQVRQAAINSGLSGQVNGIYIRDLAKEFVKIAEIGLQCRQLSEEIYLETAKERLATGFLPAQEQISLYQKGGVKAIVESFAY